MKFKHRLLSSCYLPLRFTNITLRQSSISNVGRLRVLLYHDIDPSQEAQFAAQLHWLSKSWRFITPDKFSSIIKYKDSVQDDCLLLTFDDGFASNRQVVDSVLNPMGIKALFFIITDFAFLPANDDWRRFVSHHIYPSLKHEEIPSHWNNMSTDDLVYLLESGHSIGAHTSRHTRLSEASNEDLLEEIAYSADSLEVKLGIKIRHFAFPFGDLASFSSDALALARKRFDFIYTGLRGFNTYTVPSWAIRRDSIKPTDSKYLIGSLLEGAADYAYHKQLIDYQSWGTL